ncbi:6-phosphogluconolactonase [Pedobacter sp. UYP30]|uniref:6-phosphogluconolactonase n=1 Tax=Pedobacter sp. UYP30 TaxID=1756400 RepID=UPI003394FBF9
MNLLIYKSVDVLNIALADYVIKIANQAIEEKGSFNFVLTGGNSPKELYRLLSTEYKDKTDWNKVYFFFGDERNVSADSNDYNGGMAKKNLFDKLDTAADHIFYVDTALTPKDAAVAYKKSLDKHFNGNNITFDLILLGMGDDGHTASIFPHTSLVKDKTVNVSSVFVEKLDAYRISFTAPLINEAENIAFLVFGEGKASALKHVTTDQEKDANTFPAQLIDPTIGNLTWFVDEEAAALL